jgi:hypothetical protein
MDGDLENGLVPSTTDETEDTEMDKHREIEVESVSILCLPSLWRAGLINVSTSDTSTICVIPKPLSMSIIGAAAVWANSLSSLVYFVTQI